MLYYNTEQIEIRSQLVAQFIPSFWLMARISMSPDKIPYFDVLRQKLAVFNCFLTKRC